MEIYAFAPGLDASKIDVTLDRGVLRISGERAPAIPHGDAKRHVYACERSSGSYSRAISLPDDVDPAEVTASYTLSRIEASLKDGVLTLRIPKQAHAQPRRITVTPG